MMLATGGLPFSLPPEVLTGKVINLKTLDYRPDCHKCPYEELSKCYSMTCTDEKLNYSWEYTK